MQVLGSCAVKQGLSAVWFPAEWRKNVCSCTALPADGRVFNTQVCNITLSGGAY